MDDGSSDPVAGPDGRRRSPRDSLFLHATLRRAGDAAPLTMRVRNVSAGGMMAEVGAPFEAADRIEIELRGIGLLEGTVIWRDANRIGIAFDAPIDPRKARKSIAPRATAATAPAVPQRGVKRPRLFGA